MRAGKIYIRYRTAGRLQGGPPAWLPHLDSVWGSGTGARGRGLMHALGGGRHQTGSPYELPTELPLSVPEWRS